MSRCKGPNCNAEIQWVTMEKTGNKNCLDVVPSLEGNITIMGTAGRDATAKVVHKVEDREALRSQGALFYTSHFCTCPDRADFKKKKAAAK